jgi:Putative zinc-finger
MSCDFAHHDGAYVLGALSPTERQEYEQHLATCPECAVAVRELAGLPGLLARVDPGVAQTPRSEDPVPDTLLPSLVSAVRRVNRRRQLATAGIAAAATLALSALTVAITGGVGGDSQPLPASSSIASNPATSAGMVMTPVGQEPLQATVVLERVPWGTRLALTCTYSRDSEGPNPPRPETFGLFVAMGDGETQEVGTWRLLEGKPMLLTAATSANPQDITSVEVRTADNKPILELPL